MCPVIWRGETCLEVKVDTGLSVAMSHSVNCSNLYLCKGMSEKCTVNLRVVLSFVGLAWTYRSPAGAGSARWPGFPGNAHDRRAEASIQPRPAHHHVPHPRIQVVPDAPEVAHRPALCTGDGRARVEKVSRPTWAVCVCCAKLGQLHFFPLRCITKLPFCPNFPSFILFQPFHQVSDGFR